MIDGALDVVVYDDVHTFTAGESGRAHAGTAHAVAPAHGRSADMLAVSLARR